MFKRKTMASIQFYLREGKKSPHKIYLRYKDNPHGIDTRMKTGKSTSKESWEAIQRDVKTNSKTQLDAGQRKLEKSLGDLKKILLDETDNAKESNTHRSGEWLKFIIDGFNGKKSQEELNLELMTVQIDRYIDDNDLSEGHESIYKNLKDKLILFQKGLLVRDIGTKFKKDFTTWMRSRGYMDSTIHKAYSNLRTIVRAADGIERHSSFDKATAGKKPKSKYIHYLTLSELSLIKDAIMPNEHLKNARNWLLLGCFIGQRVSDLLRVNEDSFTLTSKGTEVITLTQKKTGKKVFIPVLKEVKEIRDNGLPHPIAPQKLNEYMKEVCRISGINKKVKGQLQRPDGFKEDRTAPKWRFISSHLCRRSFATNFYGHIPTALLISITGHSSEKMFLTYIGKDGEQMANEAMEAFLKSGIDTLNKVEHLKAI